MRFPSSPNESRGGVSAVEAFDDPGAERRPAGSRTLHESNLSPGLDRREFGRLAALGAAGIQTLHESKLPPGLDRRELGRLAALGAAALWAGCAPRQKPNILFLSFDDMNDWVSPLGGHPQAFTPNFERLAKRSVVFTNAHCDVPLCSGSRSSVLTGMSPLTHRVFRNAKSHRELHPDAVSLGQHFSAHGYHTMVGGKLHHAAEEESWHEAFSPPAGEHRELRIPGDGFGFLRSPGGDRRHSPFNWGPIEADDDELFDGILGSWARERLLRSYDQPFLLGVGFLRPHLPWFVPRSYFERLPLESVLLPPYLEDDLDDVPAGPATWKVLRRIHRRIVREHQWQRGVACYLAAQTFIDVQLGRLLDALERGPHAHNTIIVAWSDHGFHLGEKDHWTKFVLWERATRVPLLIAAPRTGVPGSSCDRPVTLRHIHSTLTDLCGIPPNPNDEGSSLVPLLRRPTADWDVPAVTSVELCSHSLRAPQWRYTRWRGGGEELYDHQNDPNEWTNLAGDPVYREQKAELAGILAGHLALCDDNLEDESVREYKSDIEEPEPS